MKARAHTHTHVNACTHAGVRTPQGYRLSSDTQQLAPPSARPSAPSSAIGQRGCRRLHGGAAVPRLAPQPKM
eukprot:15200008-Alexandrium_andersonii.AAC.1